jgi:hypothetical protein
MENSMLGYLQLSDFVEHQEFGHQPLLQPQIKS